MIVDFQHIIARGWKAIRRELREYKERQKAVYLANGWHVRRMTHDQIVELMKMHGRQNDNNNIK